jgi:ribose 5-phosphate isomerase RpiB
MVDENDHHLTYIHLGIQASLLLNTGAVDFVITGCGTGQGAMMSLNAHPGVICGYCIDPTDAFLFNQVNNGNALALAFAKGFGWGAELNIRYMFEKAFTTGERGQGYPIERAEPQQRNAGILTQVKAAVAKDSLLQSFQSLDQELVKQAVGSQQFQSTFFTHCKNEIIADYVKSLI